MTTRTFRWTFVPQRDYALFMQQVQDRVAQQVMSRTPGANGQPMRRERELTEENESLSRTWFAWIDMPISAQQMVTLVAEFHYSRDRVDHIIFSPGNPVPPQRVSFPDDVVVGSLNGRELEPDAGAIHGPEPSSLQQWFSLADTCLQGLGTLSGIAELFEVGAAEPISAAVGTVGAPVAILAGIMMLGGASYTRDQVAYCRGYVLAVVDMAHPRDPNERRSEPGWFSRGRRDAIRFINNSGRNGMLLLARLWRDYPHDQDRLDYLWNDIIRSRFQDGQQRALARSLRPRV